MIKKYWPLILFVLCLLSIPIEGAERISNIDIDSSGEASRRLSAAAASVSWGICIKVKAVIFLQ